MKRNDISDEQFDEALKNKDNLRIMNSVCSRYRKSIPYDELERCKMVALWQALEAFDPNGGKKFTSFLYTRTDWECKRQISAINKKRKSNSLEFHESLYVLANKNSVEIEDIINKLSPKFNKVINQRFFYSMTMEEIAKENNYSRETARLYIIQALDKIKQYAN